MDKDTIIDLFTLGLEPKDISYTTGFPLREVREVCREHEETMKREMKGFLLELQDKGYIKKSQGKQEWKWRYKPRKITISLS